MKKQLALALCTCCIAGFSSLAPAQEFKPGQTFENNQLIQPGNADQGSRLQDNRVAQQTTPGTQTLQTTPGTTLPGSSSPSSVGQSSSLQSGSSSQHAQQGQHQQGEDLQACLTKVMLLKNKGEIELAKLAQQHAQSQEVKDFAQMMIDSHSKLVSKLESSKGNQSQSGTSRSAQSGSESRSQNASGSQQNSLQVNQNSSSSQSAQHSAGKSGADSQLASIMEQVCENQQQMTKEMLQNHKGSEFDMAFTGQQIVAHMAMLAELKAFENHGDQEFQKLVKEAKEETKHHLEEAKSIAEKLKDQKS